MWLSCKILICAVFVLLIIFLVKKSAEFFLILKYAHKLPGPPKMNVIFGNAALHNSSNDVIFNKLRYWAKTYYPVYKLWLLHVVTVNIFTAEDFETVLADVDHNRKSEVYKVLHLWLKQGLLTSYGEHWQQRRKILTPAFHFSILQEFIKSFNEQTDSIVKVLEKETQSNKPSNVVPIMTQFTLKTIAETAMGTKLDFTQGEELEYKDAVHEIIGVYLYRLFRPWLFYIGQYAFSPKFLRELKLCRILHKFTAKLIKQREADLVKIPDFRKNKRMAMLDLLLSAKSQGAIDDAGIQEEVDTFMFEGHDTTATSICFTLMLIACHPEVQENLVEEMLEVLGDLKKKPSFKELQELKYMERCLKESLRLYPSVFYMSRVTGKDLTLSTGHKIKKNTIIHLHIYDLHYDPRIYPDPEKFDPDRFLPENCLKRHPFAYVPFSAGSRNCIGQKFALWELKTLLCGILGHFILEPVDTPETIVLVVDLVLRTRDGIKVKFRKRN